MTPAEFYDAVAEVLGTTHQHFTPVGNRKKRWGPREPGNGRFPGFGLVRVFSNCLIHVSLTHPQLNGIYKSMAEALTAITEAEKVYRKSRGKFWPASLDVGMR